MKRFAITKPGQRNSFLKAKSQSKGSRGAKSSSKGQALRVLKKISIRLRLDSIFPKSLDSRAPLLDGGFLFSFFLFPKKMKGKGSTSKFSLI